MDSIKRIILDCPNCSADITDSVLCLGVPTNEFNVLDAENEFFCEECGLTYFVHLNIEQV